MSVNNCPFFVLLSSLIFVVHQVNFYFGGQLTLVYDVVERIELGIIFYLPY